jgi:pyruvate/2-oxoglutarate/acetoin dehydrogenase E1 component
MYNLPERLHLVIRTPMGGRRGYGPTHSQTLEKLFMGVPGLDILAPHTLLDPGRLLISAIRDHENPVLFIENKLLYNLPIPDRSDLGEFIIQEVPSPAPTQYSPTVTLRLKGAPSPQCTITAYGYMADLARQAILQLAYNFEIFAELVIFSQLAPFSISPLVDAVIQTKKLVTVEEGNLSLGWGAEIIARLAEQPRANLKAVVRVAALDTPVPASRPLENETLPGVDQIIEAGQKIVQNR